MEHSCSQASLLAILQPWIVISLPWLALLVLVLWDVIKPRSNAKWVRPDKISFATLVFNIVTFAGAVVGVVVAAYAYNEAKRSADLSDDRSKIEHRGQLVIENWAVNGLEVGQPVVSFVLYNTGHTPAYILNGTYEAAVSLELPERFANEPRRLPALPGILRQSQDRERAIVVSEQLPPRDVSAVRAGTLYLYLRIILVYRDIFGGRYEMRATAKYGHIIDAKGADGIGFEFPEVPLDRKWWKACPKEFAASRHYNSHKRIED